MTPPTYPARPANGGPLPHAVKRPGTWRYEPKFNGWRALVHTPTGTMFNRRNERLSIEHEFAPLLGLLRQLKDAQWEWLDCEALDRRHGLGRGSLIVLDLPLSPLPHSERHQQLARTLAIADGRQLGPQVEALIGDAYAPGTTVEPNRLYYPVNVVDYVPPDYTRSSATPFRTRLWDACAAANRELGCQFYEGLVAKEATSRYPMQLRSASQEFPGWIKHRWAF